MRIAESHIVFAFIGFILRPTITYVVAQCRTGFYGDNGVIK